MHPRRSAEEILRAQSLTGQATNVPLLLVAAAVALPAVLIADPVAAASTTGPYSAQPVFLFGIPVDFILFGLTLLGVAVFHNKTLEVALTGLVAVTLYKLLFTGFRQGESLTGLMLQLHHEWVILANLFLLLMGFAILSRHFENSRIPDAMPALLPNGWSGCLVLLATVFVMSGFLDNIAAALIGGTMARHLFKGKLHIGYLAAIVAAANAGGAGSVVGDTTTTMMWIDGISPLRVVEAYVAAVAGFLIYGIPASLAQHRHSPIEKDAQRRLHIDWTYAGVVGAILTIAVLANVIANLKFPAVLDVIPVIGLAVWIVILAAAPLRRPDWAILPETFKGTVFLLALVTNASFMPVEELPVASWQTALGLGFLSSVFDNIPLTALALKQGGYDWGFLAYAVGFGGSMIWFGSSAGVAISNMYPEAKSVGLWLRHGWYVAVAYIVGFFVMFAIVGWNPDPPHKKRAALDVNYQLGVAGHL
ncbi:citrate transporter [Bradyrhizobium sp. AUGA SZCCT0160]|uniref:citrate transporter n=1 Tax=Bradyrhizobium sp. AUGA SZCCT0160 TaxID=2807662 RepID=UPI0020122350|nr:citrate transporter [Bradyrhizobium sp. AUGA SZCCT0160]